MHFKKLKLGSKLLRNRSGNLPPFCGIKRFFEILGGSGLKGHLGVESKSKRVCQMLSVDRSWSKSERWTKGGRHVLEADRLDVVHTLSTVCWAWPGQNELRQ